MGYTGTVTCNPFQDLVIGINQTAIMTLFVV